MDTHASRRLVVPFLAGNTISLMGNTLTLVALPWFVLDVTGSAGQTGLVGMAFALPALLAGLLGGVIIDRIGGRRMSVIADLVSGVSVAAIPILYHTVGLPFWLLLVLVFLGAMLDIPGLTARRTMLPGLSERSGLRPEAMNSAYEMSDGAAVIVGPILAGFLIAWIDAANVLLIDAATFAVSAVLVGVFTPDLPVVEDAGAHANAPSGGRVREALASIQAGLRFIVEDRLLLALAVVLVFVNFFNGAVFNVVLPVLVRDRYEDATQLGFLLGAFGIGSLIGAALFGMLGADLRRLRWAIWMVGIVAVAGLRWALVPSLPAVMLAGCMLVVGLLSGPINPLLMTVRFERIPVGLRGRVFASFAALASIADPLGMVSTGGAIQRFGLDRTLLVIAVLFSALVACIPFVPVLRTMNRSDNADDDDPDATPTVMPEPFGADPEGDGQAMAVTP
ncbi:MAG: MFS transporter [Thermomicrobiales bacterium]